MTAPGLRLPDVAASGVGLLLGVPWALISGGTVLGLACLAANAVAD